MIETRVLRKIILEKPRVKKYIKRDVTLVDIDKIMTIIGPRRAGKTYFLFQIIDGLLQKKINSNQILYINFEDERLSYLKQEDLGRIIEEFYNLFPENKKKKSYFFFDEIQNVSGWPKFLRRIYDKENCKIFVTGSSAKLLSKEIATELRGRTWSYEIFPFNFNEYLKSQGQEVTKKDLYSPKTHIVCKYFEKYLEGGGFPEVVNLTKEQKVELLQNYYETVLFRDVIERNKLKNIDVVKDVFKELLNNFSRMVSVNKIYKVLKSMNRNVSKDFLYPLLGHLEDTMYCFFVHLYSESTRKRIINPKKVYFIDTGFIYSLIFKKNEKSWIYENLVAIELFRRGFELNYFQGKGECDFVATDKIKKKKMPIQVTLDSSNEREIDGLIECMEYLKVKKGLILTEDEEKEINKNGYVIQCVPVWKWLLE